MSGALLTMAATMTCPHGGTIMPIPLSPRVSLDGSQVVYSTDTFVVTGCPFLVVLVPQPCVLVQWQLTAQMGASGGNPTLTTDSVGFCYGPTGAIQGSVMIQATQTDVTGE